MAARHCSERTSCVCSLPLVPMLRGRLRGWLRGWLAQRLALRTWLCAELRALALAAPPLQLTPTRCCQSFLPPHSPDPCMPMQPSPPACPLRRQPSVGAHSELLTGQARGGGPQRVPWHELSLPLSRAGPGSVIPDRDGAALPGAPEPARETIALLTAPALSTWHGTATGEIAGWSGHWITRPPMITHFVGCLSKAEAMQSLGWWYYEADVSAARAPA